MKGEFKLTLGSEPMILRGKVHFPERLGLPIVNYKKKNKLFWY